MTKNATMCIYVKNLLITFPGTRGPISKKLGMKHQGNKTIIVYSNDDTGLTLTQLLAVVPKAKKKKKKKKKT